jgi:chemotaxis-related protein WspD
MSNGLSLPIANTPVDDCWNRIGVAGDASCPELGTVTHCRNCRVFSSAARGFFERSAPEGYLAEWTRLLSAPVEATGDDVSLLIFRLNEEWLALGTRVVAEVTVPRPIHRIPHRTDDVLIGLVNLRGQLQLCVSLHGLIGVDPPEGVAPGRAADAAARSGRLIVIRKDSETWAFPADEVPGVHRLPRGGLRNVPATLANPSTSYSQAVFAWRGHSVGYLDDQRVFTALRSQRQ